MVPQKRKLTEEEGRDRNKKYCKKYRNSMKEKRPNAEAERKQYERLKVKLQNLDFHELKKAEDQEQARMNRVRKRLALIKPIGTPIDTTTEEQGLMTSVRTHR